MDFSKLLAQHKEFNAIWDQVRAYTMTSKERGYALYESVNTVVQNEIPGAFVECGTWKGGSAMLITLTLIACGARNREIYLFDTFSGMTAPGPMDRDIDDQLAGELIAGSRGRKIAQLVRAAAPIEAVRLAVESTGYDMRLVRFVEGNVSETLPRTNTLRIALLRLDTDFYDSTMAELRHLYPRLVQGGIIIVDDYGHWQGARKAVDEYFSDPQVPFARPMLWAIDYTGRGGVKLESADDVEIVRD